MFGGNKNPSNEANKYLNQIPGAVNPYYQPYINQGQQAGNQLTDQYNQQTQNPGELFSKLGQGYQESPGYQFKLKQALGAGQNASAAGGMLGTPQDVQGQSQIASDVSSKDFNDYMQNIMGLYGLGQQGQQKMQEQGFGASTGYGDILGQLLGQQGQYGYAGAAGENAGRANNWSNLFKMAGMGLPYMFAPK